MKIRCRAYHAAMLQVAAKARVLFAVAFAGFGLQYLRVLPLAGPPWYPVHRWPSIAAGVALLTAALALLLRPLAYLTAMLLGAVLFVRAFVLQLPHLLHHVSNPHLWTFFGQVLGLAAGAWMLAACLSAPGNPLRRLLAAARYLFAAALVLFGILHFLFAWNISTQIPDWIPDRFFFANFTGLCFVCAALALATGIRARLAAYLLAAMFLLWVAILHAPRVALAIDSGSEWTSMFVAIAMAAGALAAAALESKTTKARARIPA